jgi:hypothetical protein
VLVRDRAGQVVKIGSGSSEAQRKAPLARGSVITSCHRGVTNFGLSNSAGFCVAWKSELPTVSGFLCGLNKVHLR